MLHRDKENIIQKHNVLNLKIFYIQNNQCHFDYQINR